MGKEYEFKAAGKTTVTIEDTFLRIKRKGAINFANHGMDGEKTLNISEISGVQMKEAGTFTSGYIQFIVKGSLESKGGLFAATKDENTVMFIKKEQNLAEEIKKYVEDFMANKNSGNSHFRVDAADEIRKFMSLLDDGIITEEEFQDKKKQLLGL
jgi:hypothetical protein